ncbi:MAG: histidine kinase dimerization/phospho-acceptor domain-containing protein [Burkholderiaceae bacterium]|nr:histidine kinase dimerization/phospho-acceptor domain-containing protein [Burkholderiaceae bacterium]
MVALTLLILEWLVQTLQQHPDRAVLLVCGMYLVATLAWRIRAHRGPPPPTAGAYWLPTIGVDLGLVCALQILQAGAMEFTALLGLPILMAAVLGSLTLALGTTAAATLLMLAWAWWMGLRGDGTPLYLQSALKGTGYFILAYLVHQLSARLRREQAIAEQSLMAAQVQTQVSARVIEQLSDGVLVLDESDRVRMANPVALQWLDSQEASALPRHLSPEGPWGPLLALAHRTFRHGVPDAADLHLPGPDARATQLHVRSWLTSAPQTHPGARAESLCVMFLHDLREMEARLRTEKLAAMGRMSAAVAHEIRNPLAAIVQANALLDEDLHDPAHKRLAHMVQQNAERLNRIVEEILDIARVPQQSPLAPPVPVWLDETIAQILADWQRQAPGGRPVATDLQAPGRSVAWDAEHLRRILVNLLDNAARYCSPVPDALVVGTALQGSGEIRLQVWSDGPPLDPSVERHLFEPFFSSESRSSGLGLYICRELCQRHGASIHYRRLRRTTARGLQEGNAFTVHGLRVLESGAHPLSNALWHEQP